MIDHYPKRAVFAAPTDPASVERMIDHYPKPAAIPAPTDPASVERMIPLAVHRSAHRHRAGGAADSWLSRVVVNHLSTGTGPMGQCSFWSE
jgi:hypothetical protein